MLPTHGDVIAPPRPERAGPPVSALAALITLTAAGCARPVLVVRPVLTAAPVRAALPPAPPRPQLPGRTGKPVPPVRTGFPVRPGLPGVPSVTTVPVLPVVPVGPGRRPAGPRTAPAAPAAPADPAGRAARRAARRRGEFIEPRGCLYALSQPPLMLFLCVIGGLLGAGAGWDLLFL